MPDSNGLLRQIVALTDQMAQLAERGEWRELERLESRRAALISDCFPLDDSIASTEQAAAPITRVLERNRHIMALMAAERQRLGDEIGKVRQGRQAARAYDKVGR